MRLALLLVIVCGHGVHSLSPNLPPLQREDGSRTTPTYHTSDFGARQNHPTSYDPSPPFLGPLQLRRNGTSFDTGRERIRHYYQRLGWSTSPNTKILKQSAPTRRKVQAIVDHLAAHNAPVDVKEVCESVEFVLRTRKRLLGAAKKQQKGTIYLYDLCCGHGLTGMLFACCCNANELRVILVDRTQPPSHSILLELLVQVCPWIDGSVICYKEASLDSTTTLASLRSSSDPDADTRTCGTNTNLVISTHACGALTDRVLAIASGSNNDNSETPAAAIAVMPCCYTGTSRGTPYGIQRALGVAWAADISRSYYLQSQGYHADFATIPSQITPLNRVLMGELK